jgi:hypothetical protein
MIFMGLIDRYEGIAERFIFQAHREDNNIKDFSDFVNAIKNYLGTSKSGENALGFLDDGDYKSMFESSENKKLMGENLTNEEFKEIFEKTDDEVQGDVNFSVFSKKERGKLTNKQDVHILRTPKKIEVKSYKTKKGKDAHFYVKGYSKWTSNEENYIKSLKEKGTPYSQAIIQYRYRFRTSERTASSLKTKFYRMK